MTTSEKLDHVLTIAGALVPLLSAVASLLNHVIRKRVEAQQPVSPLLSGAGTVLNLTAVNIDKAVQLAKLAREGGVKGLPAAPAAPAAAPAAPAAAPAAAAAPTKSDAPSTP